MSEPFLGEILMFAGRYAPIGCAYCDGTLLPIEQNQSLYSLLGTIYGGDGIKTFALPDLRERIPVHRGEGPGLTDRWMGEKLGTKTAGVNMNQLASHNHGLQASTAPAIKSSVSPSDVDFWKLVTAQAEFAIYSDSEVQSDPPRLALDTLAWRGGGTDPQHDNMMPYLEITFVITLGGEYPSRN